jgi:hypothetical protein
MFQATQIEAKVEQQRLASPQARRAPGTRLVNNKLKPSATVNVHAVMRMSTEPNRI